MAWALATLLPTVLSVPLAHVNLSRPAQYKAPSRAQQIIQMNEWWCSQPGHNVSLGCKRHALQQRYQNATGAERQAVNEELGDMLLEAGRR